jgi:hypothetical protein
MLFTIKDNLLKIDMGDHYYQGKIFQDLFPEEIKDNYLDILNQSFIDFTDDEYSVTKNFDDKNVYIINFCYKSKPFSFKRKIEIPVTKHEKDFKDYTNERIEKLESIVNKLSQELDSFKLSKENLNKEILIKEEEDENEEENEEESDSDKESETEEVHIPITAKGGKKVAAVVQMKNGRQVVKK